MSLTRHLHGSRVARLVATTRPKDGGAPQELLLDVNSSLIDLEVGPLAKLRHASIPVATPAAASSKTARAHLHKPPLVLMLYYYFRLFAQVGDFFTLALSAELDDALAER